MRRKPLYLGVAAVAVVVLAFAWTQVRAQQPGGGVSVDNDDLGGVVTGPNGPEAGVWVIAETKDLGTGFSKIVVTDDSGRYVMPDLPVAKYDVWVRGYGLVDSPKVQSDRGKVLNLTAVPAPSEKAAADYYPASYWYSLLNIPAKSEFPGTGPSGNGISPNMKSQAEYLQLVKTDSCWSCHQLGNKATREIPKELGVFDSPVQAWERRIQSGQAGGNMMGGVTRMGKERTLSMFADWTTRVANGELPPKPQRPQGVERNIVVTQWDWADEKAYLHDEIATDRRNPTLNAYGKLYGSPEESRDYLPVLDPVNHTKSQVPVPVRDPSTPRPGAPLAASPYWGDELIWDSQASVHNPMFDGKGRVWTTSRVRPRENPAFCRAGSDHPSAKVFPLESSGRHLAVYDPKTNTTKLISTCFSTHHLQFAADANDTLWTSAGFGGGVAGWLNTKMYDETGDEEKSQGWTPFILDTNGNGKRDAWVEPDQPLDPTKDKRINVSLYAASPSPADGSVWGSWLGFPGALIRLIPGSNPSETAIAQIYEVPWNEPKAPVNGYSPRGMDIDRNGVVWASLASGHFASFDVRKCKAALNGPNATGKHCPEGWTLYPFPTPQFKNVTDNGSAEASYYSWVDQFDTVGLGQNVPIATGNGEDALMAIVDGKWVTLRIPYPLGFFAKGMDGRIDDPAKGWKGKGLWSTYATRTPFHLETGKGSMSKVVQFQLRPDPLAK
jgi:hypothetical protein